MMSNYWCFAFLSISLYSVAATLNFKGTATYTTDVTKLGSCNQRYVPAGFRTVSINFAQYKNAFACGSCIEGCVEKSDGKECFKGIVADVCESCSFGDLDFESNERGDWLVEWNYIACPQIQPILSARKSNSWLGHIKVEGGGPVSSVKVNGVNAKRTRDARWSIYDPNGRLGCGPKVQIVYSDGRKAEACMPGLLFGGSCSNDLKCSIYAESAHEGVLNNEYSDSDSGIAGKFCENGILHEDGKTCCPKSCGICGGPSCSTRPGGAEKCCATMVQLHHAQPCSSSPSPCTLAPLTPATPAFPTATLSELISSS